MADKNLVAVAKIFVIGIGHRLGVGRIVALALINREHLFGMSDGQGPKQASADQTKDDSVAADAQGEGDQRNERKSRTPEEVACPEAQILP